MTDDERESEINEKHHSGSEEESSTAPSRLSPNIIRKIQSVLEKRSDGKKLKLDWNAFDAGGALKETEVKDIWNRFLAKTNTRAEVVPYGPEVSKILRKTLSDKKKDMLAYAKDKAYKVMILACKRIQLCTELGAPITSIALLRQFYKEVYTPNHASLVRKVTVECFKNSVNWKDDTTHAMMEHFGISYDQSTVITHSNNKGNGFIEKVVTRAENNARTDLRNSLARHTATYNGTSHERGTKRTYEDKVCLKRLCWCSVVLLLTTLFFGRRTRTTIGRKW